MSTVAQTYERDASAGKIVVGVGDMALTRDRNAEIITYALGSCIGVTIFDPVAGVGGMLHFMLATVGADKSRAADAPCKFGDIGIPLLFKSCYAMGAVKNRLIVCAAGGAEILDDDGHFKVGTRNRTVLRKLFWKNSILLASEDTGGTHSRTLTLDMADGVVEIRNKGKVRRLWPE